MGYTDLKLATKSLMCGGALSQPCSVTLCYFDQGYWFAAYLGFA